MSGEGIDSSVLADLLAFFGSVADFAAHRPREEGRRIAALALCLAQRERLSEQECAAVYFASLLRNAGALGNPAYAKDRPPGERARRNALDDVPANGARLCTKLGVLPDGCADIVRWQAEAWDGTGFPDQLRWAGVPKTAQMLHLAARYVETPLQEEALTSIMAEAGRTFAPEQARTFVTWFHTSDGEISPVAAPLSFLDARTATLETIVDILGERIDAHNGTPGRAGRVAEIASGVCRAMGGSAQECREAELAAKLFGAGELRDDERADDAFDPLARLGIEMRSAHAQHAARLIEDAQVLERIAPIVGARGEWFDGTGGPKRLRGNDIPLAARALALAAAYDSLEQAHRSKISEQRMLPLSRIETAAGTQFDPAAVRSLADVVKLHA